MPFVDDGISSPPATVVRAPDPTLGPIAVSPALTFGSVSSASPAAFSSPLLVGLVGDSRNVAFDLSGVTAGKHVRQIATWFEFFSAGRVKLSGSHSFSVGGSTVAAISAQMDKLLAVAPRCGAVLIITGTNTFNGNGTAVDAWAILKGEIIKAYTAGVRPIVVLDLPRQQSTFSPGAAAALESCRFNQMIRRGAPALGAFVVDLTAVLADPASATGDPLTGLYSDGIHLMARGAFLAGRELAARFNTNAKPIHGFASARDTYDATRNPTGNLLPNGLMQGGAGTNSGTGASGTVPSTWRNRIAGGSGTSVASVVARADGGPGNWLQLDIASTGAGSLDVRVELINAITSNFAVGDTVSFDVDMEIVNGVGVNSCRPMLTCYATGLVVTAAGIVTATTTSPVELLPDGSYSGRWSTPAIVIPTNTINLTPVFQFGLGSAGGSMTARIGAVSLRKIIDPAL